MLHKRLKKITKKGLATAPLERIETEVMMRKSHNIFPLDIFHTKTKPFIEALVDQYEIPRSFVGLTLLAAYSTAIGTAYAITTNGQDMIQLPVWGALVGVSSSGKSLVMNKVFKPVFDIQNRFDIDWETRSAGLTHEKLQQERMNLIVYRDAVVQTLLRTVMRDNPKGLLKHVDELVEWINGMNPMSKGDGIDEQFWLSTWNCSTYSAIRAGKQKYSVRRPFVSVMGGTQYSVLPTFFSKNRDTSGFSFRILFALPEEIKIAEPNPDYVLSDDIYNAHKKCIESLYHGLPVNDEQTPQRCCILDAEAIKVYRNWYKKMTADINTNAKDDFYGMSSKASIHGKIKEYALRFSALLHLSDKVMSGKVLNEKEIIGFEVMERAIKAANYFYTSAVEAHSIARGELFATKEAKQIAALLAQGFGFTDIGAKLYGVRSDANRKNARNMIARLAEECPLFYKQCIAPYINKGLN